MIFVILAHKEQRIRKKSKKKTATISFIFVYESYTSKFHFSIKNCNENGRKRLVQMYHGMRYKWDPRVHCTKGSD